MEAERSIRCFHRFARPSPVSRRPDVRWSALRHFDKFQTFNERLRACRATVSGMRPQPLIAVTDVEASSRWYQRLLGCRSAHGGREYERLVSNGHLVLQLHSFNVEH